MAFSRGRYGVEYHQPVDRRAHPLRWVMVGLAVLAAVSFFVARNRRKPGFPAAVRDAPAPAVTESCPSAARQALDLASAPQPSRAEAARPAPDARKPLLPAPSAARKPARDTSFADRVDGWITSRTWSKDELELLTLLRDAERQGNLQGARGAIERLLYRPAAEDLKDPLVRHFGDLNMQLLFSGTNTPWTATVAVKRGDTLQRIAANHRTTLEALQRLNPLKDPNRLALGQTLRVLNFPDADLVVHKQLQFAELLLKKRIFKRYYVTVRTDAEPGAYPVANETGARAADRLRALLQQIAPADRDELRLFLAPGARITVTAQ